MKNKRYILLLQSISVVDNGENAMEEKYNIEGLQVDDIVEMSIWMHEGRWV